MASESPAMQPFRQRMPTPPILPDQQHVPAGERHVPPPKNSLLVGTVQIAIENQRDGCGLTGFCLLTHALFAHSRTRFLFGCSAFAFAVSAGTIDVRRFFHRLARS